jgi:hypothetical protein
MPIPEPFPHHPGRTILQRYAVTKLEKQTDRLWAVYVARSSPYSSRWPRS